MNQKDLYISYVGIVTPGSGMQLFGSMIIEGQSMPETSEEMRDLEWWLIHEGLKIYGKPPYEQIAILSMYELES